MSENYDFDVVIVGAGVTGAITAAKFAANGLRVAILEAGPEHAPWQTYIDRFYAAVAKTPEAPWPESKQVPRPSVMDISSAKTWRDPSKYLVQTGPLPFASTYERLAGGTANHWLGTALRFLPNDFKLSSRFQVKGAEDWPIGYEDLESWYGQAEREIGVSGDSTAWQGYMGAHRSSNFPMPAIPQSYSDQQFVKNVQGKNLQGKVMRVISTPQARNSVGYQNRPPCMGNTSCVPICPIRAKWDPGVHLRMAMQTKTPPTVMYRTVAHRLDVDPATGQIAGIRYLKWSPGGAATEGRVTGKRYVLGAHAIETARLLLMSPWKQGADGTQLTVANSSDQVGRNLMDHVVHLAWALTKEPVHQYRGPLSTSGIGDFRDGEERRRRAAYIIEIGNEGWNWPTGAPYSDVHEMVSAGSWGTALRQALKDRLTRQTRMAGELESIGVPESRVTLSKQYKDGLNLPRPELHYTLSDYTKQGFAEAAETLSAIYRELGVEKEYTSVDESSPAVFEWGGKKYQYRGAGHIMGTYRMGGDAKQSVADAECRSHDHKNLFLLGSGLFPTSGTANPTLTIIALALRAADTLMRDDFKLTPVS